LDLPKDEDIGQRMRNKDEDQFEGGQQINSFSIDLA